MQQLGLGLIVGGVVCVLVAIAGYLASHSKRLFGGEPPQWLLLSKSEQEVERSRVLASLRASWPGFRRTGMIGIAILIVGAVLVALN